MDQLFKKRCTSVWTDISLAAKEAGTAKLSFKVGNKSYSTTLTFKKYVNPLKSFTVTGLNGNKNLASKFKNSNYLSIEGSGKKGSIKITPAKNWKITRVSYSNSNAGSGTSMYANKGVSSISLPMSTGIQSGKRAFISVGLVNTKDGGTQSIELSIN